jgi:hypothetical protein
MLPKLAPYTRTIIGDSWRSIWMAMEKVKASQTTSRIPGMSSNQALRGGPIREHRQASSYNIQAGG